MMLNHLFIIVLLIPLALCRTASEDRQWQDGDNRQNCTTVCSDECTECDEPSLCDPETKIECGANVSPSDPDYPLICEVTCEDDELMCPGGTDPERCRENDYCHPKGTDYEGNPCPGYCPFDCKEDELRCPVPDDPIIGCAVPPLCIPKSTDNNGEYCDHQQCPLICDPDSEQLCFGYEDHIGCDTPDECIPNCVEACPVQCSDDEIKCESQADCETNCVDQDMCKAKAKDVNGDACPDDSASHGCPINCCGDTVLCPSEKDALGCLEPQECIPTTKGMNNATCPDHSVCSTVCEPTEVKCPVTDTDDMNCKLPDECILQERDYDSTGRPAKTTGKYWRNSTRAFEAITDFQSSEELGLVPTIDVHLQSKTVLPIGETTVFHCRYKPSVRLSPIVKCYHNERELINDEKYMLHPGGDIIIRNVSFSDKGIYKCNVSNPFG